MRRKKRQGPSDNEKTIEAETQFTLALPRFLIKRTDNTQSWGEDLIKLPPITIGPIPCRTRWSSRSSNKSTKARMNRPFKGCSCLHRNPSVRRFRLIALIICIMQTTRKLIQMRRTILPFDLGAALISIPQPIFDRLLAYARSQLPRDPNRDSDSLGNPIHVRGTKSHHGML